MRSLVIWMLAWPAIGINGCAAMRPTDPYRSIALDAHFLGDSRTANQQAPLPEGQMTLQQTIEFALVNNPDVAARDWDAAAAQARQDEAFGARLPRLDLIGGVTQHLDPQRLISLNREGDPPLFSDNIASSELVLSIPLFTGGRLITQVKVADLLEQAARHRFTRSREELVFNVTSLFYNILAQQHVIESLAFSEKALTEHLKRIDALVSAQKAAKVDRMRTEVRLADIEQQLVREKNLMAIQHQALGTLLGISEAIEKLPLTGALETDANSEIPDPETALATAWHERGDYLAARAALEAQAGNVDVAKAGHWPTVSLQAGYGGRWAIGTTTGQGNKAGDAGRVGVVMDLPIFQGGQIDAKIREQRANLAAAQERLRALELQVKLDVESALLNLESAGQRAKALKKSIALAKESLRIEQLKYALAKGAIVDVLDAQASPAGFRNRLLPDSCRFPDGFCPTQIGDRPRMT